MALLEVACFNTRSARIAAEAGADRIELCRDRLSGGLTPVLDDLKTVTSSVNLPVFAMIRPRDGDFTCTTREFEDMKESMAALKNHADGFVFGILDHQGTVDVSRCSELVALAGALPCTFHRAFDQTRNMLESLEDVVGCGFKAVLSSGGPHDATHGSARLAELVQQARGRIDIIVGGGVRSKNVEMLMQATRGMAYHTAAILGDSEIANSHEISLIKEKVQRRDSTHHE